MKFLTCLLVCLLFQVSFERVNARYYHHVVQERSNMLTQMAAISGIMDSFMRMDFPGVITNLLTLTDGVDFPWFIHYPLVFVQEFCKTIEPLYYWIIPRSKPKNYKKTALTKLLPKHTELTKNNKTPNNRKHS